MARPGPSRCLMCPLFHQGAVTTLRELDALPRKDAPAAATHRDAAAAHRGHARRGRRGRGAAARAARARRGAAAHPRDVRRAALWTFVAPSSSRPRARSSAPTAPVAQRALEGVLSGAGPGALPGGAVLPQALLALVTHVATLLAKTRPNGPRARQGGVRALEAGFSKGGGPRTSPPRASCTTRRCARSARADARRAAQAARRAAGRVRLHHQADVRAVRPRADLGVRVNALRALGTLVGRSTRRPRPPSSRSRCRRSRACRPRTRRPPRAPARARHVRARLLRRVREATRRRGRAVAARARRAARAHAAARREGGNTKQFEMVKRVEAMLARRRRAPPRARDHQRGHRGARARGADFAPGARRRPGRRPCASAPYAPPPAGGDMFARINGERRRDQHAPAAAQGSIDLDGGAMPAPTAAAAFVAPPPAPQLAPPPAAAAAGADPIASRSCGPSVRSRRCSANWVAAAAARRWAAAARRRWAAAARRRWAAAARRRWAAAAPMGGGGAPMGGGGFGVRARHLPACPRPRLSEWNGHVRRHALRGRAPAAGWTCLVWAARPP